MGEHVLEKGVAAEDGHDKAAFFNRLRERENQGKRE